MRGGGYQFYVSIAVETNEAAGGLNLSAAKTQHAALANIHELGRANFLSNVRLDWVAEPSTLGQNRPFSIARLYLTGYR